MGWTHGWVLPQTGVGGTHGWVLPQTEEVGMWDTQVGAPTDWGGGGHTGGCSPQTDEVGVWDTHGCVGHTGGCSHRLRRWRLRWVRGTHGWVLQQTGMRVGSNLYVRG